MGKNIVGYGVDNSKVKIVEKDSNKFRGVLIFAIVLVLLIWVSIILFFVFKAVDSKNEKLNVASGVLVESEDVNGVQDFDDEDDEIDSSDFGEVFNCDDISKQIEKDQCLFDKASLENDKGYCVDIVDEGLKFVCDDLIGDGFIGEDDGPPI